MWTPWALNLARAEGAENQLDGIRLYSPKSNAFISSLLLEIERHVISQGIITIQAKKEGKLPFRPPPPPFPRINENLRSVEAIELVYFR